MSATRPDGRPALVLASGSPRRQELLAGLGLRFSVRPADVDETPHPGEAAATLVARLAGAKAAAVGHPGELVLAADTVVTCEGLVLGKPADADEAGAMLRRLSGRDHVVTTGVAARLVATDGTEQGATTTVTTRVSFVDIPTDELDWYVGTGEPLDKAGAYGLQGLGARFVRRIEGSPTNVIGLPLAETAELLADLGLRLADLR